MHALIPIALNTFREARRNRVFYSILFFATGLILFSVLFTEVTFVAQDRILRDTGFATLNLFGAAIAVFLGIGMVNREIEKRTIYTVIAKPVPRWAFVVGKFGGLVATLIATVGLMFLGFVGSLALYQSPIEPVLLQPFISLMIELCVITAFAIFCSTWTSSTLSGFLTVSFFVIGHLASDIRFFGGRSKNPLVQKLSELLYFALPDLERFNLKASITHLEPVSAASLGGIALYGLLWTGVFLVAGTLLFSRRDFK